jgi:hypothetical protein
MPSKAEKERRKALVQQIQQKERAEARARKPIADADLKALFEHLETTLFEQRGDKIWCHCDHTLNKSRAFLESRAVQNVDEICTWFGEYGGYCDCEVAANVTESWEDDL